MLWGCLFHEFLDVLGVAMGHCSRHIGNHQIWHMYAYVMSMKPSDFGHILPAFRPTHPILRFPILSISTNPSFQTKPELPSPGCSCSRCFKFSRHSLVRKVYSTQQGPHQPCPISPCWLVQALVGGNPKNSLTEPPVTENHPRLGFEGLWEVFYIFLYLDIS